MVTISSLQDLVAPLSEGEFLTLLRRRKLTYLRSSGANRFETLLNWETLNRLIESGTYPCERLRVTRERALVPATFYSEGNKLDPARLWRLLDHGASLIFESLDEHVPNLGKLSQSIKVRIPERIWTGAITTTGRSGALKLHYDPQDLIILQIEGTKRWQIYDSPVINPVRGMPEQAPSQNVLVFDELLRPGDCLFLPAGYWHQCENSSDRSLHVGIFVLPLSAAHVVLALAKRLLSEEPSRQPLTRCDDAPELRATEATLKADLIEKIGQLSLAELLAEHQDQKL